MSDCDDQDRCIRSNSQQKRRKLAPIGDHTNSSQSSRASLVPDGKANGGNNDDDDDFQVCPRKGQRLHGHCTGDEVIERCSVNKDERESFMMGERDDGESNEVEIIEMDRKVPYFATAIKQEDQSEEWRQCLQWLSHVGLGKHCDKLAVEWEEGEMDFHTLKRVKDEHLVRIVGVLSLFLIRIALYYHTETLGNQTNRGSNGYS